MLVYAQTNARNQESQIVFTAIQVCICSSARKAAALAYRIRIIAGRRLPRERDPVRGLTQGVRLDARGSPVT